MTAEQIDAYLHQYFLEGYKYQISNSYIFRWECDFFAVARSGYSYEVEIKVSRSDYFADFNKEEKHRALAWKEDLYVRRTYVCDGISDRVKQMILSGHWNQYPLQSRIKILPIEQVRPNKFVFAVPEGLVDASEVPDYAGLMYIKPSSKRDYIHSDDCQYVKQPPVLHKAKHDFTGTLLDKFYWYYRNNRDLPKTKSQIGIEQQQEFSNQ